MSTKKRRSRRHTYGENQRWYFDNNGNKIPRSASNRGKKHYICDICGSNVPAVGPNPPLCPRCMIPMHLMDSSSASNGRKRTSGQSNKPKFDYSSRIYYQTDGHPQYIGLPLDHPDPEDEEAVAAYLRRKEANRAQRRHSGDGSSNRRSNWRSRRRRPRYSENTESSRDGKSSETKSSGTSSRTTSGSRTRKATGETSRNSSDSSRKAASEKDRSRTSAPKRRSSPAVSVSHEEYQGTALTEDQSAMAILHSAIYGESETSSSEESKTEVKTQDTASPSQETGEAGVSATKTEAETTSKPRRKSTASTSRRRVVKRRRSTSASKSESPETETAGTDDLAGTVL